MENQIRGKEDNQGDIWISLDLVFLASFDPSQNASTVAETIVNCINISNFTLDPGWNFLNGVEFSLLIFIFK